MVITQRSANNPTMHNDTARLTFSELLTETAEVNFFCSFVTGQKLDTIRLYL